MDSPENQSRKLEKFIKKRKAQVIAVLRGDFWIIQKHWLLKWLFWLIGLPVILTGSFVCAAAVSFAISFFGVWAYMYFYDGNFTDTKGQPIDWEKIRRGDFKKATILFDQHGQIIYRFFIEVRDPIKESEIPELLANAFIAAEDDNFWIHPGVDPTAIPRAALGNFLRRFGINWWASSGASGITQQTARLVFAEEVPEFQKREHTLSRKWKEMHFAIQLEKRYTKKEILAAFLNSVYFGHGSNGVKEASRRYFAQENLYLLTPRQVAMLVSMNKGTSKYCPIFHEPLKPEIPLSELNESKLLIEKKYENERDKEKLRISKTRERNNWVLYQMFEEGYINNEQYHASLFDEKENLTELAELKITPLKDPSAGHAARMIKEYLFELGFKDEDITHYGGFQITTCLDQRIQNILNTKLTSHIAKLNSEVKDKSNPIDGSAIILDVENACVVAVFGSHDFRESPYNRVMALRSIGSGFKPFVYGAAFEYGGKKFGDLILNSPITKRGANGKRWTPKNFREQNPVPSGYIPIEVGQIRSVNLPTLRLAEEIGMDKVVLFAHKLGVWGNYGIVKDPDGKIIFRMPNIQDKGDQIVPLLPTAIGASDVNLLELITAYSVFFRNGRYLPPKLVLEIKDPDGQILYKSPHIEPRQQISKETALKELVLMRMTAEVGTAKLSMKNKDEEQQYAVKTGTSNNPDPQHGEGPGDVGMYGGSPKYIMAIRLGHDKPKPIIIPGYMKNISRQNDMQVSGGWVVGFVFREIMDAIHAGGPIVKFPPEVENGVAEMLANYPEKYK